ncbi:aBC-type multidrug transport system ATPase component [Clostridium sp. CAG:590]|nr:aBC-type multidrug transport system ATPase component [Clostridium sp. CAG:590]
MSNVIEIEGLCKRYDGFAIENLDLSIPQGGIMGFIGANGAGKTTTIYSILNVIPVDAGRIQIFGKDYKKDEQEIKQDIGVVFDEMGYHEIMTPLQISRMMKSIYHNWSEMEFAKYLDRFGLPYKKRCGTFSRGMRMKLQIAVALSHGAKLLIMDEPTSGLDPVVRNEMLDIFQEFVEEEDHTILLSSHIIEDLERIADEIAFIDKGRILLADNKDVILEQHAILKGKKQDISKIRSEDMVGVKRSAYGVEILVQDAPACRRRYPEFLCEPASLEDIMLYYVSREGKGMTGAREMAEENKGA